jgi:hypothetical protein
MSTDVSRCRARDTSWVGKRVEAIWPIEPYRVGESKIPSGWTGEVLRQRENGLGRTLLTVLWDATGQESLVLVEEVRLV